ncbi:MAG: hypothetical protein J6W61_04325 [Bacteroidales bacterium]|nr:hypothetical protein [Bacteroidales bacterium]
MKKLLVLFIGLLFGATILAQSTSDVVYLKNGSIIKGNVSNVIPNETVTIQTSDGNIFVLNMSEVTQISHEEKADGIISFPDWANDMMTKKGSKLFIGDRELSANDIQELFSNDMQETYFGGSAQVKKGNGFLTAGMISLGATIGLFIAAINAYNISDDLFYNSVFSDWEKYENKGDILLTTAQVIAIPADVFTALGCVFRGVGNGRLRWLVDEYNNSFVSRVSFNLQPGIISTNGLAFQNTSIAPGLKFTMTF